MVQTGEVYKIQDINEKLRKITFPQTLLPAMPERKTYEGQVTELYRKWASAVIAFITAVESIPGNDNGDGPECRAARAREDAAREALLSTPPRTISDVAALAAFLWNDNPPDGTPGSDQLRESLAEPWRRAALVIWRFAAQDSGYPVAGCTRPTNRKPPAKAGGFPA